MSSPPTSSTSVKLAQISQRRRKFNLKSFGSRHRKPAAYLPEETEPYEVAPGTGILNTDATAIVFGYIDREERQKAEEKKSFRKAKRSEPAKRDRRRSRSPVKKAYERYKEVHTDDGTDDFRKYTHRQHVEASVQALQEKRDDSYRIWKESQDRSRRGRMVSEDDRLRSRGANPRTGIVTPYVVSDQGSANSGSGSDYLTAQPHQGPTMNQGSWRQDEKGWSLVEDLELASKLPEHTTKEYEFRKLEKTKIDSHMQNPLAKERILRYQHSIKKVHQEKDGNRSWLDPNEPPSPRQWTPEGPSSPVSRIRKIPRKTVGSGANHQEKSTDTVVVNERWRAASIPQLQTYAKQRQRVRIVTPTHTAPSLTSATNTPHSHIHTSRSFLGHHPGTSPNSHPLQWAASVKEGPRAAREEAVQELSSYMTQSATSHQYQTPLHKQENRPGHVHFAVPIEASPQRLDMSPGQHVPAVQHSRENLHNDPERAFHHPSSLWHTYNAEKAQTGITVDAPITTTTTTTMPLTKPELPFPVSRPRPQRQDGSNPVPQLSFRTGEQLNFYTQSLPRGTTNEGATTTTTGPDDPSFMHQTCNQYYDQGSERPAACQESSLANRKATFTKPSREARGRPPLSTDGATTYHRGDTYNGWVVPDAMTVPVHHPMRSNKENHNEHTGIRTRTEPTTSFEPHPGLRRPAMRAGSGNTGLGAGPPGQPQSRGGETILDGALDYSRDAQVHSAAGCENEHRRKEGRTTARGSGGKWYLPAGKKDTKRASGMPHPRSKLLCDIQRNDSLRRRVAEVKSLCSGLECRFRPSVTIANVVRAVVVMVHHVLVTLHPSSHALAVLWGSEDPQEGGYWAAWGEVLRAGVYVLLLMGFLLAVGRVLKIVVRVARLVLRPVGLVWKVGRWCLVSW
ncbi:hypothetical protein MMC34_003473 [Xylographa carneopallida]|nr:hypothetical protein [Xylographa carneopallida]